MTTAQVAATVLLSLPFAQAQTAPDTVPHDIRAKRDQRFDDVYGPAPKGWAKSSPSWVEQPREIWTNSGMTISVVQFADYKIIRSARAKTIYTEITLKAEQVLRDPSATVQPGKTLTVLLPGGYVRLPSGQLVHDDVDLSSGVAVPTYPLDVRLAASGKSHFAGMPEDNFITAVKDILSSPDK